LDISVQFVFLSILVIELSNSSFVFISFPYQALHKLALLEKVLQAKKLLFQVYGKHLSITKLGLDTKKHIDIS
jgi:hypothetical protein